MPPRRTSNGRSRKKVADEVAPLIDAMLRAVVLIKRLWCTSSW
ncbi:hypothetical protein [Streptomyces sp. NRRL B-24085]